MAVQFDFNSIKERIKSRLQQTTEWKDILYYSANERLIDMFANELAFCMQYDEYLTRESKFNLARNTSSLLVATEFFNYTPHRKQGAIGNVRVSTSNSFDATHPYSVTIAGYNSFSTPNGSTVTAYESSILGTSDNYVDVPVVQGTPKTKTYIASGSTYEEVTIRNNSIDNNYYAVMVNGIEYTEVSGIRLAEESTSQVYTVRNLTDWSGVKFTFGNGIFGRKLQAGDIVTVKYIETEGDLGDISSTGLVTNVDDEYTDGSGAEITLYCTNTVNITGGTDYEDKESIRANAPRVYTTQDRAVSIQDYITILENLSYVSKATVWGETEYNVQNGNAPGTYVPSQENVVNISCLSSSSTPITTVQQTLIRDVLNLKKSPTDIMQFTDPAIIYINFVIDAVISSKSYTENFVRSGIISILESTYNISNWTFKKFVRQSDYIALIDGVEGVDYHYSSINFHALFTFSQAYESTMNIAVEDLSIGSIKLYVKLNDGSFDLVAVEDSNYPSGNWIFESGYAGSGTINYLTGNTNVIITSGLTSDYTNYELKLEFESDPVDLELTLANQIVDYGESTITLNYE